MISYDIFAGQKTSEIPNAKYVPSQFWGVDEKSDSHTLPSLRRENNRGESSIAHYVGPIKTRSSLHL